MKVKKSTAQKTTTTRRLSRSIILAALLILIAFPAWGQDGAVASAGGIPILVNGKIIGAIGVSGGADDPIAQAGADAVK